MDYLLYIINIVVCYLIRTSHKFWTPIYITTKNKNLVSQIKINTSLKPRTKYFFIQKDANTHFFKKTDFVMLHSSFLIEVPYQFSISISNLTYFKEKDKIQENPLVLLELRRFQFVTTHELNLDGVPLDQMHDLQARSN